MRGRDLVDTFLLLFSLIVLAPIAGWCLAMAVFGYAL